VSYIFLHSDFLLDFGFLAFRLKCSNLSNYAWLRYLVFDVAWHLAHPTLSKIYDPRSARHYVQTAFPLPFKWRGASYLYRSINLSRC